MALTIKLRQGLKAALPSTGMTLGEPLYTTDTQELYVATGTTTKKPVNIDLNDLANLAAVDIANDDLLYIYDVSQSATSVKARKLTFANLKTALNIPPGSSDELVATKNGQTAGFLFQNSAGNDGVLRAGNGLGFTDGGSFVTLAITIASQAQGDIIYRGASTWDRLPAGTNGMILKTRGAAQNPEWTDLIDGGTF
jgi:hypothetical protein